MKRIDEIFAFVAEDSDEAEGVTAFELRGTWYPMIAADAKRVDALRETARRMVAESGKRIRLVRFAVREDLEIIEP